MKKNLLLPFIIAASLLSALKCEAQMSLELKTIKVNNLNRWTNRKADPTQLQYGGMVLSGISLYVTAVLTNTSDATMYFNKEEGVGRENIRLALYFYEIGSGWKKMYLYDPRSFDFNVFPEIKSLAPGESITMEAGVAFPANLFQDMTPVYYISGIVPSVYLAFEMPGHNPIISDFTDNVLLNGRSIESEKKNCYNCAEVSILADNLDSFEDLMMWTTLGASGSNLMALYGESSFNYALLEKAFVCNLVFSKGELSILRRP